MTGISHEFAVALASKQPDKRSAPPSWKRSVPASTKSRGPRVETIALAMNRLARKRRERVGTAPLGVTGGPAFTPPSSRYPDYS